MRKRQTWVKKELMHERQKTILKQTAEILEQMQSCKKILSYFNNEIAFQAEQL